MVVGYLMKTEQTSFEQALERVKEVYPIANPNRYFAAKLCSINTSEREK